ncbi:BRI3-binding protein isoform X3 [Catharus ustulatus]|uniref:BRI3-binding protein isoform X3 n=1 Tax=Catharus ustulatus TaxID=91951 RepID=UPI00140A2062|nr:BRI3-binding protein isoform X3 [Catharus ustulatus]
MHCSESAFGDMNVVLYLISSNFCKYLLQVFSIPGHLVYPWRVFCCFLETCGCTAFCIPQNIPETGRALCHLWAKQVTPAPGGGGNDNPQQVTPSWGRDGTGQPSAGDTWAGMAQDSPQQVTPTWGRDGTGQATFCCDLTEQLCHSPWCPPGSCPSCGAQVTRGQPHLAAPAGWIPLLDLPAASGGAIPVCEDGNWLLDPRAPEGLQLPALGATLTSCSVSPLWQSSSSGRCVLWDVTFPGGLGVRVVFKPAVAQCCASIARPSLRDLLLKTRCVVGVENRSSINLSSSVVWKCVSVVCLTY